MCKERNTLFQFNLNLNFKKRGGPWPFRLKFGWEMGTHLGRSVPMFGLGTQPLGSADLTMGFRIAICTNYEWFALVWMLQRAGVLQRVEALQRA